MSHNTMIFFAGWVSGVQATGTAHVATSIARVARERPNEPNAEPVPLWSAKSRMSVRLFDFARKRRGYLLTVALMPTLP